MKKFKKIMAMGLAVIAAVSAMNVSVFAENAAVGAADTAIDYSVYDEDLVYIPEHAEMIEQYNEYLNRVRISYVAWNWSNGIYMGSSAANVFSLYVPYYFTPTSNYLYFNIEVEDVSEVPYLTVNEYDNGAFNYIGSYNITSIGSNNYAWENKKRTLNAGTDYVFALFSGDNWATATIDIYNTSF